MGFRRKAGAEGHGKRGEARIGTAGSGKARPGDAWIGAE